MRSGGGVASILYAWRKARQSGGVIRFYRRMRMKNACKTCALGMGGQREYEKQGAGQPHRPRILSRRIFGETNCSSFVFASTATCTDQPLVRRCPLALSVMA